MTEYVFCIPDRTGGGSGHAADSCAARGGPRGSGAKFRKGAAQCVGRWRRGLQQRHPAAAVHPQPRGALLPVHPATICQQCLCQVAVWKRKVLSAGILLVTAGIGW